MCGMLDGGIGRGGRWWERRASMMTAMMSQDRANPREDKHNSDMEEAALRAVNPCPA